MGPISAVVSLMPWTVAFLISIINPLVSSSPIHRVQGQNFNLSSSLTHHVLHGTAQTSNGPFNSSAEEHLIDVNPTFGSNPPKRGCWFDSTADSGEGIWNCDYQFPTRDQIRYYMDLANGGGVGPQTYPLFFSKWGDFQASDRAVWYGMQLLRFLTPPRASYAYQNGINMVW